MFYWIYQCFMDFTLFHVFLLHLQHFYYIYCIFTMLLVFLLRLFHLLRLLHLLHFYGIYWLLLSVLSSLHFSYLYKFKDPMSIQEGGFRGIKRQQPIFPRYLTSHLKTWVQIPFAAWICPYFKLLFNVLTYNKLDHNSSPWSSNIIFPLVINNKIKFQ